MLVSFINRPRDFRLGFLLRIRLSERVCFLNKKFFFLGGGEN